MLIKITRKKKNNRYPESEFNVTKYLLDGFGIDYESDLSISLNLIAIYCGDRNLYFPEHYSYVNNIISDNNIIFRPLKNERHSNILIDMFEELDSNAYQLEITEFLNKNNKKRYKGYFICDGNIVKNSIIKSSPSIPILKTSIVAKMVLNDNEFNKYIELLKIYLAEQKGDKNV